MWLAFDLRRTDALLFLRINRQGRQLNSQNCYIDLPCADTYFMLRVTAAIVAVNLVVALCPTCQPGTGRGDISRPIV